MALPAAIKNTMPHEVTIRIFMNQSGSGVPGFGATIKPKARIEPATEKDMRLHGFEKMPKYRIVLDTVTEFDERSEITLPAGFAHTKPRLLKVKRVTDTRFLPHTVCYC